MKLAMKGIIPDKQYQHDPEIKDNQGHTVCYYLWDNCIQVPSQWKDEQYKFPQSDNGGRTQAMIQAMNGQIPDKNTYHNTYIIFYNKTVVDYLKGSNLPVPNQWYDDTMQKSPRNPDFIQQAIYGEIPKKPDNVDPGYQNCDGWTVAMILARLGKEIPKEWEHDSDLKNFNSSTVAMILAQNGVIPPPQWNHSYNLQDKQNQKTVKNYLDDNKLPIPNNWYDPDVNKQTNPEFIEDAIYGKIPQIQDKSQANYQNEQQWTVALILAKQGIIPLPQWEHDPEIQNEYGNTVAMYLIQNQIFPPKQWHHDKYLRNNNKYTIRLFLMDNGMQIPDEFNYDEMLDYYYYFQCDVSNNRLITPDFNQSKYKMTFAMFLASKSIIPPREWHHKPELQDRYKCTVAMYLASKKIVPPKEWEHDKFLKNKYDQTVGLILSYKGIIPSQQWIHTIKIVDQWQNNIKYNLERNNYIFVNKQFIFNAQTEIKKATCCVCFDDEEKEFIKTKCGHNICVECIKEILENGGNRICPLCKSKDWIIPINQEKYNLFLFSYDLLQYLI